MSDTKKKEYVPLSTLVLFSVLFYLAWTCFHFFAEPMLDTIPNKALSSFIENGIIKNIVWTLPALLLIRKYNDMLFANLHEMLEFKKSDAKYLLIFPAILACIVLSLILRKEPIAINENFGAEQVIIVLFVGVTEEFVFRGWLLNALAVRNEDIAVGITSLMFLLIHFPKWICQGNYVNVFATFGFVSIIVLSIVFSEIFLKTKNILLPVGIHMFYDLLIFMLTQQKG